MYAPVNSPYYLFWAALFPAYFDWLADNRQYNYQEGVHHFYMEVMMFWQWPLRYRNIETSDLRYLWYHGLRLWGTIELGVDVSSVNAFRDEASERMMLQIVGGAYQLNI